MNFQNCICGLTLWICVLPACELGSEASDFSTRILLMLRMELFVELAFDDCDYRQFFINLIVLLMFGHLYTLFLSLFYSSNSLEYTHTKIL
ncbi:hypothetical protein E1A91_D03G158700v1 [Gossypium mustelinum]|uniref:Uncharacterized protein n=1 Tax=Gossypium mustelinum TaxID=34275 RepID=A0A5D2VNB0_GOSMU|nr:hypothetical protein E1A91_D03G158700v1 [Gossypium mustelinum]